MWNYISLCRKCRPTTRKWTCRKYDIYRACNCRYRLDSVYITINYLVCVKWNFLSLLFRIVCAIQWYFQSLHSVYIPLRSGGFVFLPVQAVTNLLLFYSTSFTSRKGCFGGLSFFSLPHFTPLYTPHHPNERTHFTHRTIQTNAPNLHTQCINERSEFTLNPTM